MSPDHFQRALVSLAVLAGCGASTSPTCAELAEWNVELAHSDSFGLDVLATRTTDGSMVVVLSDAYVDVTFDGQDLTGMHLAKLDSDGAVLALVPAPEGDGSSTVRLFASDRGTEFVIHWWSPTTSIVAGYSDNLELRWTLTDPYISPTAAFDVGPMGESVAVNKEVVYLDRDGAIRWRRSMPTLMNPRARIADNGDVFAFSEVQRFRLAAADGALLGQVGIPGTPSVIRRDGSFFVVDHLTYPDFQARFQSYNAEAAGDWVVVTEGYAVEDPQLATTGNLVANVLNASHAFELIGLDAATGEERSRARSCGSIKIFSVDAEHFFGLGRGPGDVGLARFPNR